jgi:isoquinoline 1-oxidoreductase beta subunit
MAEAVAIAKAAKLGVPVELQWTREDDMRAGRYRPMSCHRLRAGLDANGKLVAWHHKTAIQTFLLGTPFEGLIQNGIDSTSVEGAHNMPYTIPNYRVDLHTMPNKVPTLWWRSVGHSQNAFVTETFFDEVATAAGRDPVEMRLELIGDHPRQAAVLKLAAEKAGWGTPLPAGRGRGVALHESFGTKVAEVAEVTVRDDGGFSVDRVVCAVDCGIAVNPDIVRAQIEGGIGFALSATLREAVHIVDGKVKEGNFDRYRSLRIDEMPKVEVYIVPSAENPSGIGEPGVPPLAPAVANALFAVTGKRYRRLPLSEG